MLESTAKALRLDEFPLFRDVSFPVQAVLVGEHAACWLVNMRLLLAPYSECTRTEAKLACCPDKRPKFTMKKCSKNEKLTGLPCMLNGTHTV